MSRDPHTPDCSIKGCTRAVYRGYLCRMHYGMLPRTAGYAAAMATMQAAWSAARKHHRKQLAEVRKILADAAVHNQGRQHR